MSHSPGISKGSEPQSSLFAASESIERRASLEDNNHSMTTRTKTSNVRGRQSPALPQSLHVDINDTSPAHGLQRRANRTHSKGSNSFEHITLSPTSSQEMLIVNSNGPSSTPTSSQQVNQNFMHPLKKKQRRSGHVPGVPSSISVAFLFLIILLFGLLFYVQHSIDFNDGGSNTPSTYLFSKLPTEPPLPEHYITFTDAVTGFITAKGYDIHKADRRFPTRVSFYASTPFDGRSHHFQSDPMLRVVPGEECPEQPDPPHNPRKDDCVPMVPWQTDSRPVCNTMHELNLKSSSAEEESSVVLLGQGWFRSAWRVDYTGILPDENVPTIEKEEGTEDSYIEKVVLKSLRYEREFLDEYYDLHRRDAMAMEVLTKSPYVLDIYAFCGHSVLNELAIDDVERLGRRMRDNDKLDLYKLYLATSVAMAVADVHEIDYVNNATMVHYDLNPRNVAVVKGGEIKLNDFNVAEFIYWDPVKKERCKFKGRLHEPWWRAPEEMNFDLVKMEEDEERSEVLAHIGDEKNIMLDETIDIYSLGNIMYRILTGKAPRGKSIAPRYELITNEVARGLPPALPSKYFADDPIYSAMRRAMRRCYQKKPTSRWAARDIADEMLKTLETLVIERVEYVKADINPDEPGNESEDDSEETDVSDNRAIGTDHSKGTKNDAQK